MQDRNLPAFPRLPSPSRTFPHLLAHPQVIGRCKIAPSKGTEFLDRVEFANEWKVGSEHGLVHDGLQGDGTPSAPITLLG